MKKDKQNEAKKLRESGMAIKKIAKALHVSPSSVSNWVADVKLTSNQKEDLTNHAEEARKLGIETIKRNRVIRWERYHKEAENEYAELSKDPRFMFGLALYAGEGSKTGNNPVITNSNSGIVRSGIKFFLQCGIRKEDLRVTVTIYDNMNVENAVNYWEKFLGIPRNQFYRTTILKSRTVHHRCNKLENGICRVQVNSMAFMQKILCWMRLALE